MDSKWMPWLIVGAVAIGAYFLFMGGGSSGSSGYSVVSQAAPDTSATDQARYGFLSSGIGGLIQLVGEDISGQYQLAGQSLTDQYQLAAVNSNNAAAVAAAEAQAKADEAAAKASTAGHHGLSLGPLSFTW